MTQKETIYTKDRIAHSTVTLPSIFYGENDVDIVVTATFSDERVVSKWRSMMTGNRYSYTITITDE